MADRLTKITTRGGDEGETSLGDGSRVSKTHARIIALGEVDELNSWIGMALSHQPGMKIHALLEGVQHDLFDLGGALCFPASPALTQKHLARLDIASKDLNENLTPLKEFILPGGSPLLSSLHVARTIARRAERSILTLMQESQIEGYALAYLNRLSDVLFIAARFEANRLNINEHYWQKQKSAQI